MLESPFKSCGEAVESGGALCIGPGSSVREAAIILADSRLGCLPVVFGGRLVGVISESDVVSKIVALGLDPDGTLVSTAMTQNPRTVSYDQPIEDALIVMNDYGFRHVPVMIGEAVMGVISAKSLLAMA